MSGGVTDLITHAKFHLNRFTSFGSPGGRNSPFPIGLENGSYNSVRTNVLHCDVPLQKKCFDKIKVKLATDTEVVVPFFPVKCVVVLEFRRAIHSYFLI